MASAQVMRKQEHLEAGKRRLEEFRKKKAADRAKKTASTSQNYPADVSLHEKQPLENEHVRLTDSDGAGTSDEPGRAVMEPSAAVFNNDNKANDFSLKNEDFSNDTIASPFLVNNDFGIFTGAQSRPPYGTKTDQPIVLRPQASQDFDSSASQSSVYGMDESQSKENISSLMEPTVINPGYSRVSVAKISRPNSAGTLPQTNGSKASMLTSVQTSSLFYEDPIRPTTNVRGSAPEARKDMNGIAHVNDSMISNNGERKLSSSASGFPSVYSAAVEAPYSVTPETNSSRSRPSFLDSLNVRRASPGTLFQRTEPEKESFMFNGSNTNSVDDLGSSPFQNSYMENDTIGPFSKMKTSNGPIAFEHSSSNGADLLRLNINENSMDRKHDFYSTKQNEDFSALEQHIEDLTQEKFSLQRALEASRALAESLAAENSSLTDSYNQQRNVVNQLKSDMEQLQEEIKAQLVELESVKIEYTNAQLECNAADERGKLLASEVIGLEEKALRLRSSELKLERQLENSQAEIASYKKKMSSLEKDRQDLQSTIDALQEEKKLLQSKLRKASTSAKSVDVSNNPLNKKDTSTSTEDLANADAISDASNCEIHDAASSLRGDASSVSLLPENGQSTLEVLSVNIPPDQMRMIQNISALISELALEKEELMQALATESAHSSKLREFNKELSRKLEAQTQRLELLIAQSMANENMPARQPDSRTMHDNIPYADEGDEVVERVLGWIMKLFPGGPSKRRTSKLL